MTSEELMDKLNQIQKLKCETQTMEIKSGSMVARNTCMTLFRVFESG